MLCSHTVFQMFVLRLVVVLISVAPEINYNATFHDEDNTSIVPLAEDQEVRKHYICFEKSELVLQRLQKIKTYLSNKIDL